MTRALAALVVVVAAGAAGCWPEWTKLFDSTPSTEHRIEDLRVLAIEVEEVVSRPRAVTVHLIDPRGGGVAAVELRACLRPSEFAPCLDEGLVVASEEIALDGEFGAGALPIETGAAFDQLIFVPGIELDASPLYADIIADVLLLGSEPIEREVASITISIYSSQRIADDDVDDFRTCRNPDDPEQNPACFGSLEPPECGNGVVEAGESCDPPDPLTGCNEFCFSDDGCPKSEPACLVATEQNRTPEINGVNVDAEVVVDTFDVPVGDRDFAFDVDVDAGKTVRLQPTVSEQGAHDAYQPWFQNFSFDGVTDCGAGLTAGCPTTEVPSARFYVLDGDIDIAVEAVGIPVNGRGVSFADVVVPEGVTGEHPVWMVVTDGRGGMDVQRVTLRVR